MKTLKKVPVLSLVIGILLMTYALVSWFVDKGFFAISSTLGRLVIGGGLILFAVLIVFPKITRGKNKTAGFLRSIEFIVLITGAIIGFILPVFGHSYANLGTGSLWVGLALLLNGGVELYLGTHSKTNTKGAVFFIHLLSVIAGTYIYAVNFVDKNIRIVSFSLMLGVGIFFTLYGLIYLSKK